MAKKISLIVLYCVLAILVVGIVLGVCINNSYLPEIQSPYSVYAKNETGVAQSYNTDMQTDKDAYDEFMKEFNKSFEESYISSIFSGHAFKNDRIELVGKTKPTFSKWSIRFTYNTEQTIMLNGKEYAHVTNTSKVLKFSEVIFDLQESEGLTQNKMYYVVNETVNGENVTNYYSRVILCNFDGLYDFVTDKI